MALRRAMIAYMPKGGTYAPPAKSGTPYFSFKDMDENKPTGSIKIRVETISYFLKRYREEMARRKQKQAEIDAKLKEFEAKLRAELDDRPVVLPPAAGWRLGVWPANNVVANEPVGCIVSPPTIPK
ncbi:MAG: hypothetical protein WBO19_15040 [Terriglobia bacterium]|jgi:hypothetical protein